MSHKEAILKKESTLQIIPIQNLKLKEIESGHGTIAQFFSNITVEPVVLLYFLSVTMYQLLTQNLYLEKTCRVYLAYNASVCDAMSERNQSGYTDGEEAEVQKHVSQLFAISTFIQGFFPVCLMLFLGSWSDRHNKRKPLILIPILGELTAVILLILNSIYFELPVILTAISVSLPPAITGGCPCLLLGLYSYISSNSDDENKTAKIGACSTIQNVAIVIGLGSGGLLLVPLGFTGAYSICFLMLFISLIYGYWRINDMKVIDETVKHQRKRGFFMDFFNIKYFLNTLKVFFKKGPNNRKRKMIVLIFVSMLVLGAIQGEYAVTYLYTRFKFRWNEMDYSIFYVVHSFMDLIGSFTSLVIFSKYFQWKDASLGIISLVSTSSSDILYAFAPNYKYFYAAILLDIFYTSSYIAIRSLMAKLVPPHELGQSNSVFGLCEALMPSIFGPLYTKVYQHTIEYFAGTFYFISIGMYLTAICFFIWLYRETLKTEEIGDEMKKLNRSPNVDVENE